MQSASILIITDDTQGTELLMGMISDLGFSPTRASSGGDGLQMAERLRPAVILLDLGIQDTSGMALLRQLNALPFPAPVVVVTGRDATEEKVEACAAGAVDFLNRPYLSGEVKLRVQAALHEGQWREHIRRSGMGRLPEGTPETGVNLSAAFTSMGDPMCVLSADGQVLFSNAALAHFVGAAFPQIRSLPELMERFTPEADWTRAWESCQAGTPALVELTFTRLSGECLPIWCRAHPIWREGRFDGAILLFIDLGFRKRLETDLLALANRDSLTGLFNRRYFQEVLERAVRRARRGQRSHLVYLDLDNFKVVNDTAGHAAGDRLLQGVTQVLRQNAQRRDVIARFGGDEFTVLLFEGDQSRAVRFAEELVRQLDEYRHIEQDKCFSANASIGVTVIDETMSGDDALAQADAACYRVKLMGRNGYAIYRSNDAELQQQRADANWSVVVKEALREERFELWLQPIRPLKGHADPVFEVLLRLRDRDGQIIMPQAVIPVAERFGMMQQLDHQVLRKSVELLRRHFKLQLSINLSGKTLCDPHLPETLEKLFRSQGVNPTRASFEITETAMIQNLARTREIILRIKKLGCRFALDDFGSGASSLSYLRDLPVDLLKIDGSFIKNLENDRINRALVKSINEVARTLGKQTVAEYVCSAAVLQAVQELGIDYAQGFHICPPSPPSTFFTKQRGLTEAEG